MAAQAASAAALSFGDWAGAAEAIEAQDGGSASGFGFVVWPSAERLEILAESLSSTAERGEFRMACAGGDRKKFRDAAAFAQVNSKLEISREARAGGEGEATKTLTRVTGASEERKREARIELGDALDVLQSQDLQVLQAGLGAVLDLLPGREIPCCQGCEKLMPVVDYREHARVECPDRLVRCRLKCSKQVKFKYRQHHEEIEKRLAEQLLWWNVEKLRACVQEAKGHCCDPRCRKMRLCTGCKQPPALAKEAEHKLHRLEEKVRKVTPVIRRGSVSINFDRNEIAIEKTIPFASRKPPDASAEFEDLRVADEILTDLAIVLRTFDQKMIVEGHTGSTDPPEYWQLLAMNRAVLICQKLAQKGVKPRLLVAMGCPGGGAKVVVVPAPEEEPGN